MSYNGIYGKKILFFGLETMGYEKKILDKMLELGADVDYHSERPVSSQFGKAIVKMAPRMLDKKTEKYYHEIFEHHKGTKYDIIFVMKCDTPTKKVLKEIRRYFPDAELRLHMWDSLVNIPNIDEKLALFDRITSFDRKDCERHPEFGFRPLFYLDSFAEEGKETIAYDVSFCGTIHSDRYIVLENIRRQCVNHGMKFYGYYYMQSKLAYYFLKLRDKRFKNVPMNTLKFKTIGSEEVNRIFNASNAIVDIQHPSQAGLTMRTIETLGAKKKLITTNPDIRNYDFYNENNVCVIDRENPVVSEEFLGTEYKEVAASVYEYYSLKRWVLDVLTM